MRNSSVLAAVVVGSALLAFSSYCSVDAAGSVRQRNRDMFPLGHNNIKDNDNLSRFLPEEGTEEPTSYYYYAKKSKKESKKKSKGYYSDGVSTAEPTPGCKASKKSNKDDGWVKLRHFNTSRTELMLPVAAIIHDKSCQMI